MEKFYCAVNYLSIAADAYPWLKVDEDSKREREISLRKRSVSRIPEDERRLWLILERIAIWQGECEVEGIPRFANPLYNYKCYVAIPLEVYERYRSTFEALKDCGVPIDDQERVLVDMIKGINLV